MRRSFSALVSSRSRRGVRDIILVADDFAMSGGVTAGIESLARHGRISATSAIVTLPRWRQDGPRLGALRDRIAIGLHINLTLGRPLGAMPLLAPDGTFVGLDPLLRAALRGKLDREEIAAEIGRQLDEFERITGFPPDIVDGHQHVHALPLVRDGLIAALQRRFAGKSVRPLVRVPSDNIVAILKRRRAVAKAVSLTLLSLRFRTKLERAGYPYNDSFAGVSSFSDRLDTVAAEIRVARRAASEFHLVMCHPGVPSDELARIDPVVERRSVELALLGRDNAITPRLWLPARDATGSVIDWRREQDRSP